MTTTTRELKVRYVGDDSALRKTISGIASANSSLSSKLQNTGKSMFRTGRTITAGLTLPLVAFGKVALDEFTEFQQVNAQTEAALKSTGGAANVTAQHVADLSTNLGRLSAQDNEAVQNTENLLLTFTKIRNEVGKGNDVFDQASLAVQNMSARFDQSAKSSAIQLGKALNDPIAGLTSLSRVGVQFTDQEKHQIEVAMKHNDILAAQKVVLGEVNKQTAGAAAAMGKNASPLTRISLAFKDLAQSAGEILAPMIEKVVGWVQKAADWFNNLSPSTKRIIIMVGILAAALGPVIIVLGALVTAIGALLSPITLVIAGIALLAFVVIKNWSTIKRWTLAVWGWMQRYIVPTVMAWVKLVVAEVKLLWAGIKLYFNLVKTVVIGVWNGLKTAARVTWGLIKTLIINPVRTIKDVVVGAFRTVRDGVVGAWNWIKEKVGVVIDWIAGKVEWLADKLHFLAGLMPGGVAGGVVDQVVNQGALQAILNEVGRVGGSPGMLTPRGAPIDPFVRARGEGAGVTVVNVNVGGSVIAERELAEVVRREFVKVRRRNGGRLGID